MVRMSTMKKNWYFTGIMFFILRREVMKYFIKVVILRLLWIFIVECSIRPKFVEDVCLTYCTDYLRMFRLYLTSILLNYILFFMLVLVGGGYIHLLLSYISLFFMFYHILLLNWRLTMIFKLILWRTIIFMIK